MTARRRRLVPLAALALVAGACTSQESARPSATAAPTSAPPAETSSTTTLPVDTPATTPSTTAAPETTTTVAPTTTTPPPSGTPTSTATQFFGGGDPDGWLYLGRWTGNDWESAIDDDQQPRTPTVETNDVLIHELDIDPIDGTVGGTAESCADGRTGPVISPNARAPQDPGFGYRSIAFAADWPTEPRPIAAVDAEVEAYVAAGEAAFDGTDIDATGGRIEQIIVTDLDGDGDSESLVSFGGDGFSTLLLIDADTGAALTVSRDGIETAPATSDAATTTTTIADTATSETYRTLAVADLNGDGLMEFVVHAFVEDDEESTVIVNSYDGTEVTAVLTTGCAPG